MKIEYVLHKHFFNYFKMIIASNYVLETIIEFIFFRLFFYIFHSFLYIIIKLFSYLFFFFAEQLASSIHSLDKKQKSEALIALGYYHTEFRLLPTDDEPTQIDIVPYPYFARVFADKYETKTVKYYHDGHFYWVIWNQT